jgi:hypothetical protein
MTSAALPAGGEAGEAFYRLIGAAYERRSVAVSSNIHPSGFDTIMPKALATPAVDRSSTTPTSSPPKDHRHTGAPPTRSLRRRPSEQAAGQRSAHQRPRGPPVSTRGPREPGAARPRRPTMETHCPPTRRTDVRPHGEPMSTSIENSCPKRNLRCPLTRKTACSGHCCEGSRLWLIGRPGSVLCTTLRRIVLARALASGAAGGDRATRWLTQSTAPVVLIGDAGPLARRSSGKDGRR